MAYKQSNNPISRKTSPLRDKGNHPHPHKPGVISEDKLDLSGDNTSMHPQGKPNPNPLIGQPMPDVPYEEISDMEEVGADQPDYEDPDWKPGVSRKVSPLNNGEFSDAVKDKSLLNEKPATVESASKAVSSFKSKVDKKPKEKSRREKKIDKAEKSGKTRKVRRLKGREERKKTRKQRKEGKISRSQKTYAIKESRKNQ